MTTEQMAWALVGTMAAIVGAFIWREITQKDSIWKTVAKNREAQESALAETRKEFTESLDRIAGQFRSAIDAINQTLSGLAVTMGKLDATMAREYASKADLKEAKDDLYSDLNAIKADMRADLAKHAETCPGKR